MRLKHLLLTSATIVFIQFLFSSCADVRKTAYFVNQRDSVVRFNNVAPVTYLQPSDLLSIIVSSPNETATAMFNTPNNSNVNATMSSGGNITQTIGYLVNKDGYIQFPLLGSVKVTGMTTDQLRVELTKELVNKKLLVDPIVTVRQLNFKVSVLGEVSHPGVFNIVNEKVSLLEALGMAGDISIYGRKDNVLVIREENGVKRIKRLDLNSNEIFASPYYYLKSNDVVYVEANKARVASTDRSTQLLPIIFSALSLVAIVVGEIFRK